MPVVQPASLRYNAVLALARVQLHSPLDLKFSLIHSRLSFLTLKASTICSVDFSCTSPPHPRAAPSPLFSPRRPHLAPFAINSSPRLSSRRLYSFGQCEGARHLGRYDRQRKGEGWKDCEFKNAEVCGSYTKKRVSHFNPLIREDQKL
jgi:hypothetical protein